MKNKKQISAKISLWANRCVAVLMVALLFFMPTMLRRFGVESLTVLICFYCCAAVIFWTLWNVERLLSDILRGAVFVRRNVTRIRRIQYGCGVVSLICIPAGFEYDPLIYLWVIMAFLCLMVSVVASVMNAAVTIWEENELTI